MKYIKIEPLETLFFRDGKPFTMGDDNTGVSLFPPAPSVFRGFLRTLYFAGNKVDFDKASTENDPTNSICISHFSLFAEDKNEAYFPLPADLFVLKDDDSNQTNFLVFGKNELIASSYNLQNILQTPPDMENVKLKESFGNLLISQSELISYCKGKKPKKAVELKHLVVKEEKTGIGRDNSTKTSNNTGLLYNIMMIRPENMEGAKVNFIVGFDGLSKISASGLSKIGGEGKVVYYHDFKYEPVSTIDFNDNFIKMYLSTPAVFSEGWYPKALFEEFEIEILTCVIGRYQSFGGWDIKNKRPKSTYKAVPAGSVYYLKSENNGKLKEFVNRFHGKSLNHNKSIPSEYSKEGYGIVYFGILQQQAINNLKTK